MYITTCPRCHSKFQINDEQLNIANGLVECSCCKEIFQARASLQVFEDSQLFASATDSSETFDESDSPEFEGVEEEVDGGGRESRSFFSKLNPFAKKEKDRIEEDIEDILGREVKAIAKAKEAEAAAKAAREAEAMADLEMGGIDVAESSDDSGYEASDSGYGEPEDEFDEDPLSTAGFGFNTDQRESVPPTQSKEGGWGGKSGRGAERSGLAADVDADAGGRPERDEERDSGSDVQDLEGERERGRRGRRRSSGSSARRARDGGRRGDGRDDRRESREIRERRERRDRGEARGSDRPERDGHRDFQDVDEDNATNLRITDKSGESGGVEPGHQLGAYRERDEVGEPRSFTMMDKELYARLYMQQQEVLRQRDESYWTMGSIVALIVLVMQLFYIILNP